MLKRIVFVFFLLITTAGIFYYWGYLCGKQVAEFKMYDSLIASLSNDILVFDSIGANNNDQALDVLRSKIESDFSKMVYLFNKNKYTELEHIRCAISRRIRQMKDNAVLITDENKLKDLDYPVNIVTTYLSSDCQGNPSKDNWAQ